MTKQRFFNFDQTFLDNLINESKSLVSLHCSKYHLTLLPWQFENFKKSLRDTLNEEVSHYNRKLGGIVLGHKNLKLLSEIGLVHKERSFVHINVMADFFIFTPEIGKTVIGTVIKKSGDNITCLVYNCFTISLPRPRRMHEEENDEETWIGNQVKLGDVLEIHITYMNFEGRLAVMKGEILSRKSTKSPKTNISTEENPDKKKTKHKRTSSVSKQLFNKPSNVDMSQDQIKEHSEEQEVSSKKKRKRTISIDDFPQEQTSSKKIKKSEKTVPEITHFSKVEESTNVSRKTDSSGKLNDSQEGSPKKKKKQSKASLEALSGTLERGENTKEIKQSISERDNNLSDIEKHNSLEETCFKNESPEHNPEKKVKKRKRGKSVSLNEVKESTESKIKIKQEAATEEDIDYSNYVIKPDEIILPDLDYKSILESTQSTTTLPLFDFGHSSRLFDAECIERESETQIVPAKKYKKSREFKEEKDDESYVVKRIKKEKH